VFDAARLCDLFDVNIWNATVSVICEKSEGFAVSNQYQRDLAVDFGSLLLSFGFDVRVFDPAGQDTIGGGCGQLWFVQDWMRKNPGLAKKSVGHSLPSVHAPV
jgi:23S rRNA (adenine2503-C2)-methyltransferase